MLDAAADDVQAPEGEAGELTLGLLRLGRDLIAVDVAYLAEVAHISSLKPPLATQPGALGTISVRGSFIPVIDPLGHFSQTGDKPGIAALVSDNGQTTGLAVEGVRGLRRFKKADIQQVSTDDKMIVGAINDEGDVIQILDPSALLGRPGVPYASISLRKTRKSNRSLARPYLTFEAGGTNYAIKADTIFGTVPSKPVEDASLANDVFLGFTSYLGRKVPVMSTHKILGLGEAQDTSSFETVIIRFPEQRLVGLAVDKICHVVHPSKADFRPLELNYATQASLVHATCELNGSPHFLLDEDAVRASAELLTMSEMSDAKDEQAEETAHEVTDDAAVRRERERYILLRAGGALAIQMTDVDGMRTPPAPEDLTPADSSLPGMMGFFFQDGATIPLIRLSEWLGGTARPDPVRERVLLTHTDALKFGFLVDCIEGIGTSSWIERKDGEAPDQMCLVSVKMQGTRELRNALNLGRVAHSIAEAWRRE